jgi:putative Holliday junction resolvase
VVSGERILAVDYGQKHIGFACTDEMGLTVRPLPSIRNKGKPNLIKILRGTIQSLCIQKVVWGIPINMDGSRGDAAVNMQKILEAVQDCLSVPLVEFDERLSTVEALEFWRKMSPKQQKKYRTVDSLAAALILERYLRED